MEALDYFLSFKFLIVSFYTPWVNPISLSTNTYYGKFLLMSIVGINVSSHLSYLKLFGYFQLTFFSS